jgi:hypothetical protein
MPEPHKSKHKQEVTHFENLQQHRNAVLILVVSQSSFNHFQTIPDFVEFIFLRILIFLSPADAPKERKKAAPKGMLSFNMDDEA